MSKSFSLPGKILLINSRDYNLCLDICDYCGATLKRPGQKYCNKECSRRLSLCIQCQKNPKDKMHAPFCGFKKYM